MKLLWLGMLMASLFALLAQAQDRRPTADGWFNPATAPQRGQPAQRGQGQPRSQDGWFNPVTAEPPLLDQQPMPRAPDDQSETETPPDNPVTVMPLPPPDQPDNSTNSSQDLVPNPLDAPNASPGLGTTKQAQPQGQPQRGGWVQMGTATLQTLDKVNARANSLSVKVGDTGHFGSLDITVRGCFVRTPDRPTDATAFVIIRDQRADSPAFSGWMVRSAPSMSMLAHPIYDVRVTGCS